MDIFSFITLIGGLAFFLYGMHVMSSGLERMAGGKLESALRTLTSNRFKCLGLGAIITMAIQSSSAVTVMLVGLVNSGIMEISQTIGVIMGSNIGTTITAWMLTLIGIESDNVFIRLLKPENFSLIFALIGVLLIMLSRKDKRRDTGSILIGFAVLMFGMKLMSTSVAPLADMPWFTELMTAFKNPLLGVLIGAVITAVIQSSSASVGILQALALTGSVSTGAAIPIIMGQNIGTCITAFISSMGTSRNAKKVALVHVTFNLIGTAVCLSLYCIADAIFNFTFADQPVDAVGIALIHTGFNVFTTALLLPFTKQMEKLANKLLPDKKSAAIPAGLLDVRLLNTPSVAIAECENLTVEMSGVAGGALRNALSLVGNYKDAGARGAGGGRSAAGVGASADGGAGSAGGAGAEGVNIARSIPEKLYTGVSEQIMKNENSLDYYEDQLGTYLVQLSSKHLSDEDSLKVSKMLHTIGDFERLGDHAVNILETVQELHDKKLAFSDTAAAELKVLMDAIYEILELTDRAYRENDYEAALLVEPLEQTIDLLVERTKAHHIERLQKGECSIELGFILSEILNNLERVSDHCSNIAVAVIELSHHSFDTHKYLNLRTEDEQYREACRAFMHKYDIQPRGAERAGRA